MYRFFLLLLLSSQAFGLAAIKGRLGYRYGYFETELESFMSDGTFLFFDSTTLKSLQFLQTEIEGDLSWSCLYLRGEGGYGFLFSGYNQEDTVTKVFTRKASLHKGSIGYGALTLHALLPFSCFSVGPGGGFYFQEITARTVNGTTNIYPTNLEEVEYISKWRVPRCGLLLQTKVCKLFLEASYYYAFSSWQGNWRLYGYDLPEEIFSEKRSAKRDRGHFASVKCDLVKGVLRIGCSIGYESLSARNGISLAESREKREEMERDGIIDLVPKVYWQSIYALVEIGVVF